MEVFKKNDILDYIDRNNINYVGFAVTNWHLIGAKAAYEYLINQGIEIRPLYIIEGHPEQGFLDIDTLGLNIIYHDCSEKTNPIILLFFFIRSLFRFNSNSTPLFIGTPWLAEIKKSYLLNRISNIKFLIYEEGAKSYNNKYQSLRYVLVNYPLRTSLNLTLSLLYDRMVKRRGVFTNLNPLYLKNEKFVVNEESVKYYKKAADIKKVCLNPKIAIFVMQTLEPEYIKVINKVLPMLHNMGMKIYVKQHPRYPITDLSLFSGVNIITDNNSLEKMMSNIRPMYVFGFFSTALLTTRYFFNAITISLFDLMDSQQIECEILDLLKWFKKSFNDVVLYPNTIDDINNYLKKQLNL